MPRFLASSRRFVGVPSWMVCFTGGLAVAGSIASAALPSFSALPDPPGEPVASYALDISDDGLVVVGAIGRFSNGDMLLDACRWSGAGATTLVALPTGSFGSQALAVSANGSVIAGFHHGTADIDPVRWLATGIDPLPFLPGTELIAHAAGVSANGAVVVGYCYSMIYGPQACSWTSGGAPVVLDQRPAGSASFATDISGSGAVIVGGAEFDVSGEARRTRAFRWRATTGLVALNEIAGGETESAASVVSDNGSIAFGAARDPAGVLWAVRWLANNTAQKLGPIAVTDVNGNPPLDAFLPGDSSSNGTVMVGSRQDEFGFPEVILWRSAGGIQSLRRVVEDEYGISLRGWTPHAATGITPDGKTIVGYGYTPEYRVMAWKLHLGDPIARGDLNCDGAISVADIGLFVLAVADSNGFAAASPTCHISRADVNLDGSVTVADIGPFVALIAGQ